MTGRRVVYVEATGRGGGSNASLRCLLPGLDRERYAPVVVLGDTGSRSAWEGEVYELPSATLDNFDFFPAGWNPRWLYQFIRFLVRFPLDTWRAVRLIRRLRPSIVHLNVGQVVSFGCAARLLRLPVVWHIRELVAGNLLGSAQARVYAACAGKVIATSRVVASRIPACAAKLSVVTNCVSVPRVSESGVTALREAAGIRDGDFVVLLLGSELSAAKGYMFLAGVADRLPPDTRIVFLLAGRTLPPPAGSVHRLLRGIPLGHFSRGAERRLIMERWRSHVESGRAHFTGFIDASTAVAASSILVCPNQVAEPFGRSFLEGGIQRKPVVAMDMPAFNELIEHERTGWLLPPDAGAWAATIAALAADHTAVDRAGMAAEQKARACSPENHARTLMAFYDEMLRCE